MALATIKEAIEDFKLGKFVIIVDDEGRENEGDLAIAAEFVTADKINFMARYGRGLICVPLTGARLDELKIPIMVEQVANTSGFGTAFTISVEARYKVTTGISAADRAATVRALLDPATKPEDLARPGHTFPLRAHEGGVLVRAGQTEAVVDLARLAGLTPAGVICEIMKDDGTMARLPDLEKFAGEHDIRIISVASLIEHRRRYEKLVRRVASSAMPTRYGVFQALGYATTFNSDQHFVLTMGDLTEDVPTLMRMHSECLSGDVFGSMRCDCGEQLDLALRIIAAEGRGVIVYLKQEGRGIGLHNKLRAYALQDKGLDTVEANVQLGFAPDLREYGVGAQILVDLGLKKIKYMTNNPHKLKGLEQGYGLTITEIVPVVVPANQYNEKYLQTKIDKMGHLINLSEKEENALEH